MRFEQGETENGNGVLSGAVLKSPFDLGWAERADAKQQAAAPKLPKNALFRCEIMADGNGRAGAKIETMGVAEQRWSYAYDKDGRLTEVQLNSHIVEQYAYDHEGRRAVSKCRAGGGASVEYVYDAKDRLLSMGDVQFAYDSGGRMIAKTERGQTTRYAYDDSGFLAYVEFPGGQRLTYERDAYGLIRRILMNGQPQEEFVWRDGLRLESWRDVIERRTLEFHYEEESRVPHAVTVYEGGYTYHCALGADQVGTIKTVADDTGYLIKELQYDSFGSLLEDSNSRFYLPLGFAGGILDRHTGLVRFGWRYYMPEAGRFTALDPARWQGGDPDLYDYCIDDPISRVDPLGLEPEVAGKKIPQGSGEQVELLPHTKVYWTFLPKPEACEKCQAMKGLYFDKKPSKQVHPNCKCEIVSIEASRLPYDRNRIIIPPGVDLNANIAEARRLGRTIKKVPFPPNQMEVTKLTVKACQIALYFIESFRSGGKYDYKRFGSQYDPFGNYHYGLYCRAIGLNDTIARAMAGAYQVISRTTKKEWRNFDHFGDDPDDQHNIKRGQESLNE